MRWLANSWGSEGNNVMICWKSLFYIWKNFNYYDEKFGALVCEHIFGVDPEICDHSGHLTTMSPVQTFVSTATTTSSVTAPVLYTPPGSLANTRPLATR